MRNIVGSVTLDELLRERDKISTDICEVVDKATDEWGIKVNAEIIGFNTFIFDAINDGKIKVNKTNKEYSVQDNYAYSRELDDNITIRKLVEKVERYISKKEDEEHGNTQKNNRR